MPEALRNFSDLEPKKEFEILISSADSDEANIDIDEANIDIDEANIDIDEDEANELLDSIQAFINILLQNMLNV